MSYTNADYKMTHAWLERQVALRSAVEVPVDSRLEDCMRLVESQREIIAGLRADLADSREALRLLRATILKAWRVGQKPKAEY